MMPHITQVAAVEPKSGDSFNVYVTPKVPISHEAQQVTKIVASASGEMTVNGQPVHSINVQEALEKFIQYLDKFRNVILVAHNGRRFDFPVLVETLKNVKCFEQFSNVVLACVDSLPVFKKVIPGAASYKQEDLVQAKVGTSYGAHDALEDVKSLGDLVQHLNISSTSIMSFSFSLSAINHQKLFNSAKAKNIDSLNPLIASGVMKRPTAENIAGSGLSLKHLYKIFERDGEDGLVNVFTCKNVEGQPRVTNAKKTLETVIPLLVEYLSKK